MQRLYAAQPREPRHAAAEDQPASRHLHRSAGAALRVGAALSLMISVGKNARFASVEVDGTFTFHKQTDR